MKNHALWFAFVVLGLAACSQQETPEPQQPAADQAAAPAEEAEATEPPVDEAFTAHMHAHAEQLDNLMFALADGDLEKAGSAAYWLSQHEMVEGLPEEWEHYVTSMRNAAYEVEIAEDLDAARAAAEEISAQCQACHTAAGVSAFE